MSFQYFLMDEFSQENLLMSIQEGGWVVKGTVSILSNDSPSNVLHSQNHIFYPKIGYL